jgi:PAS domain S-box-containing protein
MKSNRRTIGYYFRFDFTTIQGKITSSLFIVGVLAGLIMFYPIYVYQNINKRYERIFESTIPTKYYCSVIEVCMSKSNSALDNYLITSDKFFVQKRNEVWQKDFRKALDSLLTYTKSWENSVATSLVYDVSVKANSLRSEQDLIERQHDNKLISDDLFGRNTKEQRIEQLNKLDLLAEDIINLLEHLIELQEEEIVKQQKQNKEDTNNLFYEVILLVLLVVCVGVVLGSYVIISILRRIRELKYTVREIARGNIPDKLPKTEDEIGSISDGINILIKNLQIIKENAVSIGNGNLKDDTAAFNNEGQLGAALVNMKRSLKEVAEEGAKRNWANIGVAKFSDILRNNSENLEALSEQVITELVKYMECTQGLIYISPADSFGQSLKLYAWYAYDRKKYREKVIQKGDGLIGEVFQEKKTVYMTDVPTNYLTIRSGLGETIPSSVLIVPLKVGENVYGIIELASLKKLEPYQIEFIEKIAESIASSIISLENNEKTKKLLEAAQINAEMLRAQEEEMRQNVEELQTTQEEMRRLAKEMEMTIHGLENSLIYVELSPEGTINNINQIALQSLGYTTEDIQHKHLSFIFSDIDGKTPQNKALLSAIEHGDAFSGNIQVTARNGAQLYWHTTTSPIRDSSGKYVRTIQLSYDITIQKSQEKLLQEQNITIAEYEKVMKDKIKELSDNHHQTILKLKEEYEMKLRAKEDIIKMLRAKNKS